MLYIIAALAILARFIPHMPNFVPITALAIFAAAYVPKKQALAISLGARLVSDLFLGFFPWPLMIAVYLAHGLGVVLGVWIKNSKNSFVRWGKITGSGFVTAGLFYLITNFALLYPEYPHTGAGVMASYINGLPFLRGTLLSDVGYTLALFTSYALARTTGLYLRSKGFQTAFAWFAQYLYPRSQFLTEDVYLKK